MQYAERKFIITNYITLLKIEWPFASHVILNVSNPEQRLLFRSQNCNHDKTEQATTSSLKYKSLKEGWSLSENLLLL